MRALWSKLGPSLWVLLAVTAVPVAAAPHPDPSVAVPIEIPRTEGPAGLPLVVIDAGHGGIDMGVTGTTGLREKDVTLDLAKAVRDALFAGGKVRVAMTRNDDRYLLLRDRVRIARKLKAALFISIHCDSSIVAERSGAAVYTVAEVASDTEAARTAARENRADAAAQRNQVENGGDVSSILLDLTERKTINDSAAFARILEREARALIPIPVGSHRMAAFTVLGAPDVASVLLDAGFLSSEGDSRFLQSADGRARIAKSVARAVAAQVANIATGQR